MSDMVLYHGEPNGPSLAVLAALFETGLDVELRHINLLAGERHTISGLMAPLARDMGVEGEGPVLVIDGEALTESVFIAQFLDEAAGGVGLQPSDPYMHWQMLMWCRRMTERAAPAYAWLGGKAAVHAALAAIDEDSFAELASHIVSDDLKRRWHDTRAGSFSHELTDDSLLKVKDGIAGIEAQLADGRAWLMGEFSIADLETAGWNLGTLALVPNAFDGFPRALAWQERVKGRPSMQRALALATLPNPEKYWAPGPEINRWG